MFALVLKNAVVQVEINPFPVHEDLLWVLIPENQVVEAGYAYINGIFEPPVIDQVIPPAEDKAAKIVELLDAVTKAALEQITKEDLQVAYDKFKAVVAIEPEPGILPVDEIKK